MINKITGRRLAIEQKVGYEDPAFFRRLFKRITGVTTGAYRRKFQIPEVEIVSSD
jgi:YesN/AraC family two-component response regulator